MSKPFANISLLPASLMSKILYHRNHSVSSFLKKARRLHISYFKSEPSDTYSSFGFLKKSGSHLLTGFLSSLIFVFELLYFIVLFLVIFRQNWGYLVNLISSLRTWTYLPRLSFFLSIVPSLFLISFVCCFILLMSCVYLRSRLRV